MSFSNSYHAFLRLTRLDKPIGIYLLLWPTYWALWIASEGAPSFTLWVVFTLGVIVMRSAGCIINDYADRHVDGKVKRTHQRPLVSGQLTEKQALAYFGLLVFIAFLLVLTLSTYTILLSFVALGLATIYPFMKRYTHLPQVFLGMAFSWSMIMVFAEVEGRIPLIAWLLFGANLCWTVAYDTLYAMVDRDDDVKIGVKSSAILFGKHDKKIVGFLQLTSLVLLFQVSELLAFSWAFQLSLVISAGLFTYQQILVVNREREACFKAFLNNHWVGLIIFSGLLLEYL